MKSEIIGLLVSMAMASAQCDEVALIAYEIQFNRQHELPAKAESVSIDERLIQMDKARVPVETHPAWKARRVREFAMEWHERCLAW